jgi:hypothetical protein
VAFEVITQQGRGGGESSNAGDSNLQTAYKSILQWRRGEQLVYAGTLAGVVGSQETRRGRR